MIESSDKVKIEVEVSQSTIDTLQALRNTQQSLGDVIDDLIHQSGLRSTSSRQDRPKVRLRPHEGSSYGFRFIR